MNGTQQERDAATERWLLESVVPEFDRVIRGEEKLLDASEVFSGAEMRYRMRVERERVKKSHPLS